MYSGSAIGAGSSSVQGSEIKIKKKYELGGKMNPDEARMNRMLLQEISRVKRGEGSTSIEMLRGPIWKQDLKTIVPELSRGIILQGSFSHSNSIEQDSLEKLHVYIKFKLQLLHPLILWFLFRLRL